ncbi:MULTISPECIES: 3-phosphoshikimate 1-carboxyvinyltransferase [unclassified Photorhabdus]|uniref:3-phosphoshikimate 1-carboxyvinyltransferase n=1 Tax=unclassified Photorhabdus TaxID=2620880 RepID=UPI000DCBAEF5|nr:MULTISPECIES: 3-phosphoshikimate 1-carboxyvinyltransferase [unclassified Photorhabdus]RAW98740.1 3-phosphoshikimate 1-carboxyvinyltransferase [Photorhabdus sp. S10-54]RAW98832.1 3-phosphoshikimate 1-carboxyvinyltransferase [Photorhabdus sp. S9-53]RAX03024.1 3-phosphoshikimate 1-carboxyvinyltransferase [Photorhabdus sp. S8-52]
MNYYGNNHPPFIEINKTKSLNGSITLPASKSSSTRAILTASLTEGTSKINNMASGNNTTAMKLNCSRLGASFNSDITRTIVEGIDIRKIDKKIIFNPGNSGVVLRLLMGVAGYLPDTEFITEYSYSLGTRSQSEMVNALKLLNIQCTSVGPDSLLPISMKSDRNIGSYTEISCRKSSQFLSGLLYLGAISERDLQIKVIDTITAPSMVHTTINNLRKAGINIEYDDKFRNFFTTGKNRFIPSEFSVGADPASTAAILALCTSLNSDVTLNGFFEEELGNGAVVDYLINSGTKISFIRDDCLNIRSGGILKAQDFDGSLAPDAVPALAALAAFADGKSVFYNIEHIRYKESDRISDFRRELDKIGIRSEEKLDQLIIYGNPYGYKGGIIVDGHYDHGLIMALTTIGLHCDEPLIISEPYHVGQTYPEYFAEISTLGANVNELKYSGPIPEDV